MSAFERFSIDLADVETLEGFYLAQTNTETAFLQMSPGPAVLNARSLDFGDLRVLQVSGQGTHLWDDRMLSDEWRFAIMTEAEGRPTIGHSEVTRTTGHLLRPGEASVLCTKGRYTTLEFTFDEALPDRLGWSCKPGQTAEIDRNTADTLIQTAGAVLAAVEHGARDGVERWRGLFLDLLEMALKPWFSEMGKGSKLLPPSARSDLLNRARMLLQDRDFSNQASVAALAQEVGVSRRSLFLAFKSELGLGPRRFRELVRLNALRSTLLRATPGDASVTLLANDHGFSELGRMAGTYRNLFGELPSETLRRAPRRMI